MVELDYDYKALGNRIKEVRKEQGLQQYKLAEIVGISPGQMSQIENGKEKMGLDVFIKLCLVLDTSPAFFLFAERENRNNLKARTSAIYVDDSNKRNMLQDIASVFDNYTLIPKNNNRSDHNG